MIYLKAVLLAVVEGFTEFLPVSSTGHMILVNEFVQLSEDTAFVRSFLVIIQLPAIMSVILYFWRDLWPFTRNPHAAPDTLALPAGFFAKQSILMLWAKVLVAVIPALVLGALLADYLDAWLFRPIPVAVALAVGGVMLIVLEYLGIPTKIPHVHRIGFGRAFGIGLFQCLAMIPGTSRSAATIIGGMLLGASRPAAAEFSFFLAIPTMTAAFAYKLLSTGFDFTRQQWAVLAVGSVVSFLVAYAVIAVFMNYIRKHDFSIFGYYRLALAALVFLYQMLVGFA
jgi:undecaprenyl-diphosphatase